MGTGPGTIVVVEDDVHISDLVALYLRRDGYRVLQAENGEAGLRHAATSEVVLVILDLGLPGAIDGYEVCRKLRGTDVGRSLPVVMVTARDDELDRILGLELGADDYVTKPFSPRELVARVHAVLRRTSVSKTAEVMSAVHLIGDVSIDTRRRVVEVKGAPITCTAREFDLLSLLARNRGIALSRRQLLDGAWGANWIGDERTVDVHVRQLRKKLGRALPLTTLWGVGYRLD